nr:hypothetical protein [Tanacetum cinerariifolium]
MTLTFAETHNMVAYLTKSNASEGFNQIIDLLHGSSIKLQALVDKKKVVVTEATIRDALRLDDTKGVKYLPNEEIFAYLVRMGYKKPSTKLTFYKAFFSCQWKFLIHTILQCMSAKKTSWNEFSSSMASAVICLSSGRNFNFFKYIFDSLVRNVDSLSKFYMYPHFLQLIIRKQVGDLSTHTTKYTSPALTHEVFANMRPVGKGLYRVETPLFEGMVVAQEVGEGVADEVHDEGVPAAGVTAEGDVSAANDEVPTTDEEPSIPSPTPHTPPPQPSHDIPSISQIAQALEITRLKRRVRKLERRNKVKGRMISDMDVDADVVLEEAKDVTADAKDDQDADVQVNADIQERTIESQAKIYKIDLDHANKFLSMQEEESEPVELQEVVDIVTTAKIITEKEKGVVIRDPEESSTTTSTIIHFEAKSKDKEAELNRTIDWDEVIDHVNKKAKEDKTVKRYQAMKRKPQTEAQARKNMMVYLKNVDGFKMDYFKGMTYDDIRPVFEKHFDLNVAFLQKTKEHIDEEESRALKRINETPAENAAKRRK